MSDPLPAPSFNLTYSVPPTDIGSGYAAGITEAGQSVAKALERAQNRRLKLLKRQGRVALYSVHGPQGLLHGYEVVIIQFVKERDIFGVHYPDHEALPSNEDWGTYGWSYQARDLAGAEKRYQSSLPKWGANVLSTHQKATFVPSEGDDSRPVQLQPLMAL